MSNSLRPVDCSPPSSAIHGILQARILEWVAISFTRDLPDPGIELRSPTLQADALTSAPPGKPLNKRIQVLTSKISREERKPGGRKKREEAGEGGWNVSCHLQIPRRYGTFPWASREGRTGTQPYQKSDQTRTRIWVLCQEEVINLQSSAQAEGPSTRFLRPGPGD